MHSSLILNRPDSLEAVSQSEDFPDRPFFPRLNGPRTTALTLEYPFEGADSGGAAGGSESE